MSPPGPLVLLVEDYEDAREMYTLGLEMEGFSVISAGDGLSAIRLARQRHPAAIVMDAGLPLMSGWEATAVLKADASTLGIPILMLTGHVLPESEQRALAAGADVFLTKPYLPDELGHAIRTAMDEIDTRTRTAHTFPAH